MFYGKGLSDPAEVQFLREAIARFRKIFGRVFAGDNVILFQRTLGYRGNQKFMSALAANASTAQEKSLELRLNTLAWAAEHALHVAGDFVECGVWRGFCSAVIAAYLDFERVPKSLFLYDTFEGIPAEYDAGKHNHPALAEAGLYDKVVGRFRKYPNVRIVKGVIPESFAQAALIQG